MMTAINPKSLQWAMKRSGISRGKLEKKFTELKKWENDIVRPTYEEVEKFAEYVRVPSISLFIPPPDEATLIPDLRTVGNKSPRNMSSNLIDTIYACQNRQAWYRNFSIANNDSVLKFVGSATTSMPSTEVAENIRKTLKFCIQDQIKIEKVTTAIQVLSRKIEDIGVLVMINGVVGNNSRRPLNVKEFRGFALSDSYAPVIFVNGKDVASAQMFTLAHELSHIWLDSSGLTSIGIGEKKKRYPPEEIWCNSVAAEFLVPEKELRIQYMNDDPIRENLSKLAKVFCVSRIVILYRLQEIGLISKPLFDSELKLLSSNKKEKKKGGGGGDYYRLLEKRVSRKFGGAVVSRALEGRMLYRDAYRLLGVSSADALAKFNAYLEKTK